MPNYTRLIKSTGSFDEMIRRFGVVTVMNAKIYEYKDSFAGQTPEALRTALADENVICQLDTLKVANVTEEGPTKTITGGQYANPLIKYGKTARLEMQDALGNIDAIDALCGGVAQWAATGSGATGTARTYNGLHFGSDFNSRKLILGESFFLDKDGNQVDVDIIFYQFLPDSLFNLTQDAEGDATVFDMNGDLLVTKMQIPAVDGTSIEHGVFYSILAKASE